MLINKFYSWKHFRLISSFIYWFFTAKNRLERNYRFYFSGHKSRRACILYCYDKTTFLKVEFRSNKILIVCQTNCQGNREVSKTSSLPLQLTTTMKSFMNALTFTLSSLPFLLRYCSLWYTYLNRVSFFTILIHFKTNWFYRKKKWDLNFGLFPSFISVFNENGSYLKAK